MIIISSIAGSAVGTEKTSDRGAADGDDSGKMIKGTGTTPADERNQDNAN